MAIEALNQSDILCHECKFVVGAAAAAAATQPMAWPLPLLPL